tara:strand:+ start:726 stop:1781 length:1056 start_codon:yes stop_codon:yes gene_type:complete
MAKLLQLRGGTTSQHSSFTGAVREVTVDTDKDVLVVHDGSTAGGFPAHRDLKGADIASADPLVIVAGSNYYIVTGTTGFNDMTVAANHHFFLEFAGALVMTHVGGALDLPSAAAITTVAGDVGEFFATAANVVTCVNYTRADGSSIAIKNESIDSDHYVDGSIDNAHLADDAVNSDELATGAVDNDHMAVNSIDSDQYVDGSIDGVHLAVGKDGALSLDATPDTDHTANGPQTSTLASGYSSTIMDLVYLGTGGKWLEADSDATATSINLLGIALEAKTDTQAMNVALPGSFVVDASWTFSVGVPLYVSGTLGAITSTKPTGSGDVVRTVGYSLSATTIFFDPSPDYVTLA